MEWLADSSADFDEETTISRLLLVDREAFLVNLVQERGTDEATIEKAVFGRGFDNGFVVITRRLMATGLPSEDDPETSKE